MKKQIAIYVLKFFSDIICGVFIPFGFIYFASKHGFLLGKRIWINVVREN